MRARLLLPMLLAACASGGARVAVDPASAECARGVVRACRTLGERVQHDDPVRAFRLYAKGCALDDGESCNNFATMAFNDDVRAFDSARVVELLEKSCRLGSGIGCMDLALTYQVAGMPNAFKGGERPAQLRAEGRKLLEKSCTAAIPPACVQLAGVVDDTDPVAAVTWLQRGCDQGEMPSCTSLGLAYDGGKGVAKDSAAAGRLYERACAGSPPETAACHNLAVRVLATDPKRLFALLLDNCARGQRESCHDLDEVAVAMPATASVDYEARCARGEAAACRGAALLLEARTSSAAAKDEEGEGKTHDQRRAHMEARMRQRDADQGRRSELSAKACKLGYRAAYCEPEWRAQPWGDCAAARERDRADGLDPSEPAVGPAVTVAMPTAAQAPVVIVGVCAPSGCPQFTRIVRWARERYGSQVAVEWRHFRRASKTPPDDRERLSAAVVCAARRQNKLHDLDAGGNVVSSIEMGMTETDPDAEAAFKKLGLDGARFRADVVACKEEVDRDWELVAKLEKSWGPEWLVNGRRIYDGTPGVALLRYLVDSELRGWCQRKR